MPPPTAADPVPPYSRSSHVLRPHHILLLYIFYFGFYSLEDDENALPKRFSLALHRIMLREVSEVTPPRSYKEIISEVNQASLSLNQGAVKDFLHRLYFISAELYVPEAMTAFMRKLPHVLWDRDEDDDVSRFHRRSLFGYFCRRCYVSFTKLSIGGIEELHQNFQTWLGHDATTLAPNPPGYLPIRRDIITNDYQLFKTKYDKVEYADSEPYILFMKGLSTGDSNVANVGLRRFFEQKFNETGESGLRQHAMLNLARLYYLRREIAACRKTLEEAIGAARTAGDNRTLQHCSSLLHRLPPLQPGRRPIINEPQPDMHPLEVLADVKKLLDVKHQQPLSAVYERIVQAVGIYDHYLDVQGGLFVESEQYAQHAAQSVLWSTFGCSKLARIEEDIVTAFTDIGGDDNTRLTVTLNRAYWTARQGQYQSAIASLLDPDVWRGLTIPDYNLWASEIWRILALRACRRRQQRQLKEYLGPRRPQMAAHHPREYQWATEPFGSIIRDPLHEVMVMRLCDQSHACVDQLLTALWHAEYHGRYGLYRTAVILLADVGLEFGMTRWCRRILDEVMPQIMSEGDKEQTAFAQYTLARCIIAAENTSQPALQAALPLLDAASRTYEDLEMISAECDVLFLLSVVAHNAGRRDVRDAAAARHAAALKLRETIHVQVAEPWIEEVWSVVTEVGGALAAR